MTLREFLNLKLLRDNVVVYERNLDYFELCELNQVGQLLRNWGVVEEAALIEKGKLAPKYLDFEIIELWATDCKYKTALVLSKHRVS